MVQKIRLPTSKVATHFEIPEATSPDSISLRLSLRSSTSPVLVHHFVDFFTQNEKTNSQKRALER